MKQCSLIEMPHRNNPKPEILDVCCGSRMFYFDKNTDQVLFVDKRQTDEKLCDGRRLVVNPDVVADFKNMPFDDSSFNLVVFDPPHFSNLGEGAWMAKKYGRLEKHSWQDDLSKGFDECWRVLKTGGTLVFKWNETQHKLKDVLSCFSQRPLFGHTTTHNLKTYWCVFYKH